MQARAVDAVRTHDAAVEAAHGPHAVWAAVSHADVIKSVIADALGVHLDEFQRIVVDPASVTVIRYTPTRPFVVRVNDLGSLSRACGRRPAAAPRPVRPTATPSSAARPGEPAGFSRAARSPRVGPRPDPSARRPGR